MSQDRVKVDPVTFEVIRHRLVSICAEQGATLKAVSGSPIVTEASDYNIALYLGDGTTVVQGKHGLTFSGTMPMFIENIIKDCEEDSGIGEGDMFISNDPYKGGMHQSDIAILTPVFHDGRRLAWAGAAAHQLDIGGMEAGSWCHHATEKQQEGLTIPPVKIVEKGKLRKDILNLITTASRLPHLVALDIRAMIAANNVANNRLTRLMDRYGSDIAVAVMEGMVARSEKLMRERLRELPDGIYRAVTFLDHDGRQNKLYKFAATVTKKADTLTVDFSGSSEQAPTFINCTYSGLVGGVTSAVLEILAPDLQPWNGGLFRPVKIVAPERTICNAESPAPCSAATCAASWESQNAALIAFDRLMGCHNKHRREVLAVSMGAAGILEIAGWNQYGEPFGTLVMDSSISGAGAASFRDGLDHAGALLPGILGISDIETMENFAPILYLYRGLIQDTEGPGQFRGGRTGAFAFVPWDTDNLHAQVVMHGVEVPPSGIFGGFPGPGYVNTLVKESNILEMFKGGKMPESLNDIEGQKVDLGAKPGTFPMKPGDVFEMRCQGGGGYGDPLQRDPELVHRDVVGGIVSIGSAKECYGVVIDPETMLINKDETAALRAQIRRERLSQTSG